MHRTKSTVMSKQTFRGHDILQGLYCQRLTRQPLFTPQIFFHSLPLHFMFYIHVLQNRAMCFSNAPNKQTKTNKPRNPGIFIAMLRWCHWLKKSRNFNMGAQISWHFYCPSGARILDLSLMSLTVAKMCKLTPCLENLGVCFRIQTPQLSLVYLHISSDKMVLTEGVSLQGTALLWSLWWRGVLEKRLKLEAYGWFYSSLSRFHCLSLVSSLHCPRVTCAQP